MSQFYGWLRGHRGTATRCGSRASGEWAKVQSWSTRAEVAISEYNGGDALRFNMDTDRKEGVRVSINGVPYTLKGSRLTRRKVSA